MEALDLRGVGVIGAWAAGMRELSDDEHLLWGRAETDPLQLQCQGLLPLARGVSHTR